jgi:hypothetical protein
MAVALRGNLRDFGISEVFQLIGQQRKTGILEVEGSSQKMRMGFLNGAIVWAAPLGPHEDAALAEMLVRVGLLTPDRLVEIERHLQTGQERLGRMLIEEGDLDEQTLAETDELLTSETIFNLLRLTEGSFHFTAKKIPKNRESSRAIPAEQILMDGLRMVDEWRTLDEAVTHGTTVLQRVGRFETYREVSAGESPQQLAMAEKLFLLIDGRLTVRRIIDLSRLGTFEATRLLSRLRGTGVIEPMEAEVTTASHRRRRTLDFAPARTGFGIVVALLPFAFLFLLAWFVPGAADSQIPEGLRPWGRDPAQRAEQSFETRRLRHLVEAYRFATGEWPRGLGELVDHGWLSPHTLAAREQHPYYYVRRGDAALVLAPEQ